MEPTTPTVACPHCGERVRAAARVCKGCRRALDPEPEGTSEPSRSADAPRARRRRDRRGRRGRSGDSGAAAEDTSPAVLDDLRDFVVSRGLMTATQFEETCGAADDVPGALGQCVAAAILAPAQVESVSATFWQSQGAKARSFVYFAVQRGLLTPAQGEAAVTGYAPVALQQSVGEYTVSAKLMTAAQVDAVLRGMEPPARALQRKVDEIIRNVRPHAQRIVLLAAIALVLLLGILARLSRIERMENEQRAQRESIEHDRNELDQAEMDRVMIQEDRTRLTTSRRRRVFIVARRFDTDSATGKAMYEAVSTSNFGQRVVLIASEGVGMNAVGREMYFNVVSDGEREMSMHNGLGEPLPSQYFPVFRTVEQADFDALNNREARLTARITELEHRLGTARWRNAPNVQANPGSDTSAPAPAAPAPGS